MQNTGNFLQHHTWVSNPHNHNVCKTLTKGHVKSKNCVYLIFCQKCDIQYVGTSVSIDLILPNPV